MAFDSKKGLAVLIGGLIGIGFITAKEKKAENEEKEKAEELKREQEWKEKTKKNDLEYYNERILWLKNAIDRCDQHFKKDGENYWLDDKAEYEQQIKFYEEAKRNIA